MTDRNANRPGYKKTRLGWIPDEWLIKKLTTLSNIINSNVDKKTKKDEIPVKLCNYLEVYNNQKITENLDFMEATATEAEIEKYSLKKNDVIITKDSETREDIANSTIVWQDINQLVCGYHLTIIRPKKEKVDGLFLSYRISYGKVHHHFVKHANGATRYGLTLSTIHNTWIPLPPIHEQKKIAEMLGTWDKAIEQTRALIEAKRRLKKGLMQQLLTGRMRFPEFGPAVKKAGELPEGWEKKKLHEIVKLNYGKSPRGILAKNGIIPVVGTSDEIRKGKESLTESETTIIGRKGSIDNVSYFEKPVWVIDTAFYSTNHDGIQPKFLYFLLDLLSLEKFNESTGVPSLSISTLNKLSLRIPNPMEQQKICNPINIIDKNISQLNCLTDSLHLTKKDLMKKLLSGEIRTNKKSNRSLKC